MPKAQTPALGASIVRAEIKAKIKRMRVQFKFNMTQMLASIDVLEDFIDGMAERSQKRPGGLGRKRK